MSNWAVPGREHVINLTPHPVRVVGPSGVVDLPSAGVARVVDHATPVDQLQGMDVVEVEVGQVQGLPEPQEGVTLLVSRVLALACPERDDLVFPFGEIRDEEGRIVAVTALARLARRGDRTPQRPDAEVPA